MTAVRNLVRNDQMMLRIHGCLHVIADHTRAATTGGHRACIGIGQGDLAVRSLRHLLADLLKLAHLLFDRLHLLFNMLDASFRHERRLSVRAIEFCHVACDAVL